MKVRVIKRFTWNVRPMAIGDEVDAPDKIGEKWVRYGYVEAVATNMNFERQSDAEDLDNAST